jgi:Flp pilus assembly secretin CpaC
MTGSLRAHLLTVAAAGCMTIAAASAQDLAKANTGTQVAAIKRSQTKAPGTMPADAGISSDALPSSHDAVAVMIDHAKVVRLPERTQTVIIGNPMIADITVQKNGIVVVTGKSYGVTNLIALDGAGTMLAESLVSVQAATESIVVVQRGLERESYSCTPNCQPAILLGDAQKYFGEIGGQAGQRNTLATQR